MNRLGDLARQFGARETVLVGGLVEIGEGTRGAREAGRSRGSGGGRTRLLNHHQQAESGRLSLGSGAWVERLTKGQLVSLSRFLTPPRRFFLTWHAVSPADSASLYLLIQVLDFRHVRA